MIKTTIMAAMHHLAEVYAHDAMLTKGAYSTATQPESLRGLPPDAPIVVVDTRLRFTNHQGMMAALARFTNVRRIAL